MSGQTPEAVRISVVVCTRNRASQLKEFLESARGLAVPAGLAWELVIVDGGDDETPEVVEGFAGALPVRLVKESRRGLASARNRGVEEARGEYVCWTDDDVVIDPQWLAAYAAAFDAHPEGVVFGGRILPLLLPPTPDWFAKVADQWPITTVLAKRDFGDEAIRLDVDHLPWGANYAIRLREQRRHAYNPALGAGCGTVGEETDVIRQILAEGGEAWWVPASKVHHITQSERQSAEYIYRYYQAHGSTWAFLQHTQPDRNFMGENVREDRMLFGAPLPILKRIVKHGVRYGLGRLTSPPPKWLPDLRWLGFYVGALGYWRTRTSV